MSTMSPPVRYDRILRVIMWLDAFWSVAFALVALLALPAVAVVDVPDGARQAIGIVAIVLAVFLALCGAITGIVLISRMRHGAYHLPSGMRVPLPRFMHPELGADSDAAPSAVADVDLALPADLVHYLDAAANTRGTTRDAVVAEALERHRQASTLS